MPFTMQLLQSAGQLASVSPAVQKRSEQTDRQSPWVAAPGGSLAVLQFCAFSGSRQQPSPQAGTQSCGQVQAVSPKSQATPSMSKSLPQPEQITPMGGGNGCVQVWMSGQGEQSAGQLPQDSWSNPMSPSTIRQQPSPHVGTQSAGQLHRFSVAAVQVPSPQAAVAFVE